MFDLHDADWSARMSDKRLREALRRLSEPLPPDGAPNHVTDDERARFTRYVDVEIARRAREERTP